MLVAAIATGALLRFGNLNSLNLSPDESASWIAASAPSIKQVLTVQARANPGELGLHDLLLHFWMRLFGDSLIAMRSLSALAGTIAILLIYLVIRELRSHASEGPDIEAIRLPAALAALFFAVNLVTIKYSREARMYPLALMLTLMQVWCFFRALRKREFVDYAGMALMTALMIITSFTAVLVLLPEALFLLLRRQQNFIGMIGVGVSVVIGLALVIPVFLISVHLRGGTPSVRTWEWIHRPAPWATIALFNKATGTFAFPLLILLVVAGSIRGRRGREDETDFLLLWTFAPPLFLTAFSYAVHPAFVERYMLSGFVPFFALAASGVFQINLVSLRPVAVVLVVALSLMHIVGWSRRTHGMPWAAATAAATREIKPGERIGVMPRNGINVVRYYVRNANPSIMIDTIDSKPAPDVVIVTDTFDQAAALEQRYPRVLAFAHELVVRGR